MFSCCHKHYFTRFNLGLLRLALAEAPLEADARMAPALLGEMPSRLAIEAWADLKPGCALAIYLINGPYTE